MDLRKWKPERISRHAIGLGRICGWLAFGLGLVLLVLYWAEIPRDKHHGGLYIGVPAAVLLTQGVLSLAGAYYAGRRWPGGLAIMALGLVLLPASCAVATSDTTTAMVVLASLLGWPVWVAMRWAGG